MISKSQRKDLVGYTEEYNNIGRSKDRLSMRKIKSVIILIFHGMPIFPVHWAG